MRVKNKAPNMARVNLTRGTPEGPKSEDHTRVNVCCVLADYMIIVTFDFICPLELSFSRGLPQVLIS